MNVALALSIISLFASVTALIVSLLRNRWMAKQMRLTSAVSIINWLEEVRPERHMLYRAGDQKRNFAQWSDEEKNAANKVSRRLDILGILEGLGYLDQRLVDRFYGIPAKDVWDICKDWVESEQFRRGPHYLWEFKRLAGKVEHVKSNHPANAGTNDWPKKPRLAKSA